MIPTRVFYPKRTFKAYAHIVRVIFRLKLMRSRPQTLSINDVLENPYRFKIYRRIIDTSAFTIYGHWVKKGEQQNRAALFELEPKHDIKTSIK